MMHEEFEGPKSSASPKTNGIMKSKEKEEVVEEAVVSLDAVTARWTEGQSDNTLEEVNLRVHKGQLIAVVGQVGAGKVSLIF